MSERDDLTEQAFHTPTVEPIEVTCGDCGQPLGTVLRAGDAYDLVRAHLPACPERPHLLSYSRGD